MEKSKNGILSYDLLKLEEQKEHWKKTKIRVKRIEDLNTTLIKTENLLFKEENWAERKKFQNRHQRVLKLLEENLKLLKNEQPKYYELKYNRKPVKLEDLQKQIKPNNVILSYFISDTDIFILAIKRNDCIIKRIPKTDNYEKAKKECLQAFWASDTDDFKESAYTMYKWLVEPIEEHIKEVKHLVVIPDESLQKFPFDTLIHSKSNKYKEENLPYLFTRQSVLLNYSLTYFYQNIKVIPKKKKKKLLLISVSNFYHEKEVREGKFLKEGDKTLKTIAIQHDGEVKILKGKEATKENFLKYASEYDQIIIFTHGIEVEVEKGRDKVPYLIFAKGEIEATPENRYPHRLSIEELVKMDLSNVELMTICSCGSGRGVAYAGEGAVAFSKAALYAGAKFVIYTIGDAYEEAARVFLLALYDNLKKDMGRRGACRQAKLKVKNYRDDITQFTRKHFGTFLMAGSWRKEL